MFRGIISVEEPIEDEQEQSDSSVAVENWGPSEVCVIKIL